MMKQRDLAQINAITMLKTYVGKTKVEISKNSLCKIAYFPGQLFFSTFVFC